MDGKIRKNTKGRFGVKTTSYSVNSLGALPRDVIKLPALAGGFGKNERVNHPTQKPLDLCEKLIKSTLKKGENNFLVVPFAGSGSECVAAQSLKIPFIGFEINKDFVCLGNERLQSL
jgi:site-specific DNA-methyltransferase (adenine-specific)